MKFVIGKAYNRMEWEFLRKIMLKVGFDERWVHLAMQCVSTTSYLVLLNGEPQGLISPSKGIK